MVVDVDIVTNPGGGKDMSEGIDTCALANIL
jgi:hypothetical protein